MRTSNWCDELGQVRISTNQGEARRFRHHEQPRLSNQLASTSMPPLHGLFLSRAGPLVIQLHPAAQVGKLTVALAAGLPAGSLTGSLAMRQGTGQWKTLTRRPGIRVTVIQVIAQNQYLRSLPTVSRRGRRAATAGRGGTGRPVLPRRPGPAWSLTWPDPDYRREARAGSDWHQLHCSEISFRPGRRIAYSQCGPYWK